MNPRQSLKAITRRAIPLFYISPAECRLAPVFSGSGSGGSATATLDIFPVERKAGPAALTAVAIAGGVQLTWSSVEGAYSYVVYRSSNPEGPFTLVVANEINTEYVDPAGVAGNYYKITALEPDYGETFPSPIVVAS